MPRLSLTKQRSGTSSRKDWGEWEVLVGTPSQPRRAVALGEDALSPLEDREVVPVCCIW